MSGLAILANGDPRWLPAVHNLLPSPVHAAAPFSWFFWAGQWIPVTLVGFACLHAEGLSLKAITHAQDGDDDPPGE